MCNFVKKIIMLYLWGSRMQRKKKTSGGKPVAECKSTVDTHKIEREFWVSTR